MLESVQKVIPIVIRHLDGYVDLVEHDLSVAKKATVSRAKSLALLSVSVMFALLFTCLLIVAIAWDSDYRLLTIGLIAGGFVAVAIASGTLFVRQRQEPFASLKREWREDRALMKSILSNASNEEASA